MQPRRLLILSALLAACTPKTSDTGDDSGSSAADTGGAEATSATVSGSTTGDSPTGPSPTTSGATDDSGTSTSTSTSPSPSTSDAETLNDDTGDMSIQGACEAVCAHFDECSPGSAGPVGQCVQTCVKNGQGSPECSDASIAQWSCVAGLSCEEAIKFLEGKPSSCLVEAEATDQACTDLNCGGEIGGGDESCEFQRVCGEDNQTIVCDGMNCTCEENGVPGAQCPAEGLCALGPFEQRAAINDCCGWEWK